MADQNDDKGIKVDVHLHVHFNVTMSKDEQPPAEASPEAEIAQEEVKARSSIALGNPSLGDGEPFTDEEFQALLDEIDQRMIASQERVEILGDEITRLGEKAVQNYRDKQAGWAYPGGNNF